MKLKGQTGLIVAIIIMGVLVVAAAGVGGYFYYRYRQSKKQNEQIASELLKQTKMQSVTATATPISASPVASATQTTGYVSSSKGGLMPVNGYVIPGSDTRLVSESELTSFTPWQLKVARNEIYARRGRAFVHKDLQCYFATQAWYSINPNFSESQLSTTENKNVATIQAYEQKTGSPLQSHDSGC